MKKRVLSFMLIVCMALAMMPMTTFAIGTPPEILTLQAVNAGSNVGLGIGDKVEITFNQNTNKPTITAAEIDSKLKLNNGHSWGNALANGDIAWNEGGNILTITFNNVTNSTIQVGDTITLDSSAGIKDSGGTTDTSTDSKSLTGTFSALDLQAAINAAATGETITLSESIDLGGSGVTVADKNLILDLNGKTITYSRNNATDPAISVNSGGNLTITDNSGTTSGRVTGNSNTPTISNAGILYISGGTVTTNNNDCAYLIENNGTITISDNAKIHSPGYIAIRNNSGTVNLTGGEVKLASMGSGIDNMGTLTISGGTVENNGSGVAIKNTGTSSLSVSGGTLRTAGDGPSISNYGAATISGGIMENTGGGNALFNQNGTTTISGIAVLRSATGAAIVNFYSHGDSKIFITRGTVENTSSSARIIMNDDILDISGGTVTGVSTSETIFNRGVLNISGGTVENTGSGSAINNDIGKSTTITSGGIVLIKGGLKVMNTAPDLSGYANLKLTAGPNLDGSGAALITAANLTDATVGGYRYLKIEQKVKAPTATVTSVTKVSAKQTSVSFSLTNSPAFANAQEWKVYTAATGDSEAAGITASNAENTLTLTHATDVPGGTYYVAVTETGKAESDRLALTVVALPSISINDCSVTEGNSGTTTMTFTVSLDKNWASPITVDYATADDTATAGSDYVSTSGTLTFEAGQTTKTIPVTINGDTNPEINETFFINLSNQSSGIIGDSQGTGTILNDDLFAELTPNANINYINEALTGLTASAAYTVNGTDKTADASGKITIENSWFGTTISLVKKGDGTATTNSAVQSIALAARPAAPSCTATQPTASTATGTISGISTAMQYSTNNGATWTDGTGSDISGIAPGTVLIRVKATGSAPVSLNQSITITAYSAPPSGGGGGGSSTSTLVTKIESGGNVTATNVDNLVKEGKKLTVEGKAGEKLVFDTEALKNIDGQTKESLKVEIKDVSVDHKTEQPGRLVVSLTITAGGKHITSFGNGTATISLPYELKAGEKAADVNVWYLAEDGTITEVPCSYDSTTKLATFKVSHFSLYVVGALQQENEFNDVTENNWFYNAVSYISGKGLMKGTGDKIFNPHGKTTRGMVVAILWRMENSPKVVKENNFADVKNSKYYYDAVAWASENGIAGGYSAESFRPDDSITREQLAVILFNYASYKGYKPQTCTDLSGFSDYGSLHKWSKDAMSWTNGEGLINGIGSNLLNPQGKAERCQVAATLQRFMENVAK